MKTAETPPGSTALSGGSARLSLARPGVGERRCSEKGTPSLSERGSSAPGRARRLHAVSASGALARGGHSRSVRLLISAGNALGGTAARVAGYCTSSPARDGKQTVSTASTTCFSYKLLFLSINMLCSCQITNNITYIDLI